MNEKSPQQLILDVQLAHREATLANFIATDKNQSLLDLLGQFFQADNSKQSIATQARHLYIYGEAATGKTHLLKALQYQAAQKRLRAQYISLKDEPHQAINDIVTELLEYEVVCIDDLQHVASNKLWQQQLFYFYNRAQEQNKTVFFAASDLPEALGYELQDLVSRLKWGLIYRLHALDDRGLQALLIAQVMQRGIDLDEELVDYMMIRVQRKPAVLLELINRLDNASWQTQRAITKPFIKQVLGW